MARKHEGVGQASLLYYWKNGNERVEVDPDPPSPEEANPFHVVIRNEFSIPVSYLIFARDKKHALSRLIKGIKECIKGEYKKDIQMPHDAKIFGKKLLQGLKTGQYVASVEPIDTAKIVAQVNWASNGGLF